MITCGKCKGIHSAECRDFEGVFRRLGLPRGKFGWVVHTIRQGDGTVMDMDRRDFLRTTGTLIAGATIARPALAKDGAEADGRMTLPMNRGWRYSTKPSDAARERGFDDSHFDRVVVPHTNVKLPWHSFDEKLYAFVSVYRRHFKLPAAAKGRHVFVDFEGVMTASTVWLNGTRLGEYKGGFTSFSFELTPHLDWDKENVLVVEVDSTERADIPPFGYQIDYLTFGGIYREVSLRVVPATYLENIFVQTKDVLTDHPSLNVQCFLQYLEAAKEAHTLEVTLKSGERVIAHAAQAVTPGEMQAEPVAQAVTLTNLGKIDLWDLDHPHLYSVEVKLLRGAHVVDSDSRTIGFREAQFTDSGFQLNGKVIKLRGLDRHQTFPFVGQAMPARVAAAGCEDTSLSTALQPGAHFALSAVAALLR